MKKFTTSAQKTLTLPKDVILNILEEELSKETGLTFRETKVENISMILIAARDFYPINELRYLITLLVSLVLGSPVLPIPGIYM